METNTKVVGGLVAIIFGLVATTIFLIPTGTTDRCSYEGIRDEWRETEQPFLYYCAVEDKYEWCLNVTDWGGTKNHVCHVAIINRTIPPQNISLAEWVIEPTEKVWVETWINCTINSEEFTIYLHEPDAEIDLDLEQWINQNVGNISLVTDCKIINSSIEELINKTYCKNKEGVRSFFRERLEEFNVTEVEPI